MWYVIWVFTGSEEELINRFKEIIPEEMYTQIWTPYKIWLKKSEYEEKQILKKMFPGYIFIDTDHPDEVFGLIKQEKKCMGMLKSGNELIPISEEDKQIIQFFTGNDGIAGVSLCVLENGRLKILDGPLKGMDDKIFRLERNNKKAWIRVQNLLGKDRELSFAVEIVDKK